SGTCLMSVLYSDCCRLSGIVWIKSISNAITVLVRKLRQRLQAVGSADWIESIYAMGYRLASPEKS
ncbi:helix-turn-helix domain-containing protein, partial [Microcoleus sp. T2B6]